MNHNSLKSASSSAADILVSSFKKRAVTTLAEMKKLLKASRPTTFRALKHVGYLSSYSHAGKFYTLSTIPRFDSHGLWFHRYIGFSKHGTLRRTIVVMVKQAPAGYTHEELQAILQLKVHNTLHDLVRDSVIGRVQLDAVFLYVALDANVSRQQVEKRMAMASVPTTPSRDDRTLDLAGVVEILLIVIHKRQASVPQIRGILGTKGVRVSDREVEDVLDRYGLKKKKKRSLSRRSKK